MHWSQICHATKSYTTHALKYRPAVHLTSDIPCKQSNTACTETRHPDSSATRHMHARSCISLSLSLWGQRRVFLRSDPDRISYQIEFLILLYCSAVASGLCRDAPGTPGCCCWSSAITVRFMHGRRRRRNRRKRTASACRPHLSA